MQSYLWERCPPCHLFSSHVFLLSWRLCLKVLKSLWSVISLNLSMALSVLTFFSVLVFSGGTLLLNFVSWCRLKSPKFLWWCSSTFAGRVHHRAFLFALLLARRVPSNPVGHFCPAWICYQLLRKQLSGNLFQGDPVRAGLVLNVPAWCFSSPLSLFCRSVFHATLRRVWFYSLYTWMVLSVLGIPMTILPSGELMPLAPDHVSPSCIPFTCIP